MYRKEKVSDLLHSFLAEEMRALRDPRLQTLNITAVKISSDLKSARVFWSGISANFVNDQSLESDGPNTYLEDEEKKYISKGLDKAKGYLRKRIGEELELRNVPDLNFSYDESLEQGNRIDFLLQKAGYGA